MAVVRAAAREVAGYLRQKALSGAFDDLSEIHRKAYALHLGLAMMGQEERFFEVTGLEPSFVAIAAVLSERVLGAKGPCP